MKVTISFMNDGRGTEAAQQHNENGETVLMDIFHAQGGYPSAVEIDDLTWSASENGLFIEFTSNAECDSVIEAVTDSLGNERHEFKAFGFTEPAGKEIKSLIVAIMPKP
jgi:hypothetical protein